MKTRPNLIGGELQTIAKQLRRHESLSRMYSKKFYDKHFVKTLGRQLTYEYLDKDINASETDEDYILEVRRA